MAEPHIDLIRFVDGELSVAEADTFREHLRACAVCAAHLAEEIQLAARLSTLLEEPDQASRKPTALANRYPSRP
jgi:anti-sigma factor RsiW